MRMLKFTLAAGIITFIAGPLYAAPAITSFDPPGSVKTNAMSINAAGTIVGWYQDAQKNSHGFLRSPVGLITTFDVPASVRDNGIYGTMPESINENGSVAGGYGGASHGGFIRAPDGTFTTFATGIQTSPVSINKNDIVAGVSFLLPLSSNKMEGFERIATGGIARFAYKDSIQPAAMNDTRVMTGEYYINKVAHGFVRALNGTITSFDPPGSIGTFGAAINNAGTIAGGYYDGSFSLTRAFVRNAGGALTTFSVLGASSTYGTAINGAGRIAGDFVDRAGKSHGFVRTPAGTVSKFDPANSVFTQVTGINNAGAVTGFYTDADNVEHAFVRSAP